MSLADVTSSGVNLNNRELRRGDGFFRAYSLIILHSIDSIKDYR